MNTELTRESVIRTNGIYIIVFALSLIAFLGLALEEYILTISPFVAIIGCVFVVNQKLGYYITAFLIPFSFEFTIPGAGAKISAPGELLLAILFVTCFVRILIWGLDKDIIRHPIFILVSIFSAILLMSSAFSVSPAISFKIVFKTLVFIFTCYFAILSFCRKDPYIPFKFLLTYMLGFAIVASINFFEHSSVNFSRAFAWHIPSPFYYDHTIYATAAAFMIPLSFVMCIWFFKKIELKFFVAFFLFLCCCSALILSYSRGAWMSVILAFAFYGLIRFKIRWPFILISTFIAGMILFSMSDELMAQLRRNNSDSKKMNTNLEEQVKSITNVNNDVSNLERLNRWNSALRMIKREPLHGFGHGTYQFEYFAFQKHDEMTVISIRNPQAVYEAGKGGTTHSEYLLLASENGVFSTLTYVALLITGISIVLKRTYSPTIPIFEKTLLIGLGMSLVTYVIHSFFNNFLDTAKICFPFYGVLAAITSLDLYLKKTGKI